MALVHTESFLCAADCAKRSAVLLHPLATARPHGTITTADTENIPSICLGPLKNPNPNCYHSNFTDRESKSQVKIFVQVHLVNMIQNNWHSNPALHH